MPQERFQEIYGDVLFLGELHRGDSAALATALDSLLDANGTDTAELFATARALADDREMLDSLYRVTIRRFERLSSPGDSTAAEELDPYDRE